MQGGFLMKLKKSVAILMALAMLAASGCSSAETGTQSAADGGESAAASTQEDRSVRGA